MRKNSIKNTRINGEVLRELSNIIRGEIKDPRINPMTSVVTVEVAPDLKTCKAYISVLGDEESQKATLAGLRSAEGYIRRQLAHSINLRNTPEITFVLDQSIEYGVRMSKMIDDVTKDIPDRADGGGRGNRRMTNFDDFLAEVHTVAIGGHIRPDGDCVGSCLATYNYIKTWYPDIDVTVYLEPIPNIFKFMARSNEIVSDFSGDTVYDLFIAQDCRGYGTSGRCGAFL